MKIGLIGAMDEEVEILKNMMVDRTETTIAGSHFYEGQIHCHDVILLQSGIGKVNAAIGTTLLNQIYHPEIIINTGSAGGFNPDLQVGDIVISTEVRHHDVDVTVFNYEYGQVPQMPAAFKADAELVQVAEHVAKDEMDIQVVKGLIATGDSFMSDSDRVAFIKHMFPTMQAAEMEAAAIAQVCYQFKVPFVIIRSLSDIAGKEANISFDQFLEKAAKNSANLIIKMLKEIDKIGEKNERGEFQS